MVMTCGVCKYFGREPSDDEDYPTVGLCYFAPPVVSVIIIEEDGVPAVRSVSSRPEVDAGDRACHGFARIGSLREKAGEIQAILSAPMK